MKKNTFPDYTLQYLSLCNSYKHICIATLYAAIIIDAVYILGSGV